LQIGVTKQDSLTFSDTGLIEGKVYTYRINSFNKLGNSPGYSNELEITPQGLLTNAEKSIIERVITLDSYFNILMSYDYSKKSIYDYSETPSFQWYGQSGSTSYYYFPDDNAGGNDEPHYQILEDYGTGWKDSVGNIKSGTRETEVIGFNGPTRYRLYNEIIRNSELIINNLHIKDSTYQSHPLFRPDAETKGYMVYSNVTISWPDGFVVQRIFNGSSIVGNYFRDAAWSIGDGFTGDVTIAFSDGMKILEKSPIDPTVINGDPKTEILYFNRACFNKSKLPLPSMGIQNVSTTGVGPITINYGNIEDCDGDITITKDGKSVKMTVSISDPFFKLTYK
jgi:hypothetical protein